MLIRGIGTGAVHVMCGVIVGMGLLYLWDKLWIRIAGTVGLLALAIIYHAVYNLLVSQTGLIARIGYLIPMMTVVLSLLFDSMLQRRITM